MTCVLVSSSPHSWESELQDTEGRGKEGETWGSCMVYCNMVVTVHTVVCGIVTLVTR